MLGVTGCDKPITGDKEGDGKETWNDWETTVECRDYVPSIGPKKFKWLSHGDVCEIQYLLSLPPQEEKVEELGRFVNKTTAWRLESYKPSKKHYPFTFCAGGVYISALHPVKLCLVTVHDPERKPFPIPEPGNSDNMEQDTSDPVDTSSSEEDT